LRKIYSPYFPHIVFYGPQEHAAVEFCDHYRGWFSYKDIALAMQKYPDYAGYLFINDDLIINPRNFERFNKDNIWMCPAIKINTELGYKATDWPWWPNETGCDAMEKIYPQLAPQYRNMLVYNQGEHTVLRGDSDIVYIPRECAHDYIQLCPLFAQHKSFLEVAIPTICNCIMPKEKIEYINGIMLWYNGERNHACDYLNPSVDYVHPIKLSNQAYRDFVEHYFEQLS
jgi:hypothetical protein